MPTIPLDRLPEPLREAARSVSAELRGAGYQAWIVGGAVRDLVLGCVPTDIDIATDAWPDAVERLFQRTTAVGKAFGTIVVHLPQAALQLGKQRGVDIEVTTFRADGQYTDGRRPQSVAYSDNLEADAARRDFTCNAMFLDVESGELRDPEGGQGDLSRGRLSCVGDPGKRFAEDGLRLMRLARFEARFALEPTAETLAGAKGARANLGGVSRERLLVELSGLFQAADPARGLRRLQSLSLLELIFPGSHTDWALRTEVFGALQGPLGPARGLALLLDPWPNGVPGPGPQDPGEPALASLLPSKALSKAVQSIWSLRASLSKLAGGPDPKRSQTIPLVRQEQWPAALANTLAWAQVLGEQAKLAATLELGNQLQRELHGAGQEQLNPAPLLVSADLLQAGIERGPRWGKLLAQAAALQLDGVLTDRATALEWLLANPKGTVQE